MIKRICLALVITLFCVTSAWAWTSLLWKTGQTTVYRTGDDGDLKMGATNPSPRFSAYGDCVIDNLTGIMWPQNANLLSGAATWQAALEYANSLTLCGYADWRLPNKEELLSLVDYSQYQPSLPVGHPFTNMESGTFWSSTTFASGTSRAWVVSMWDGNMAGGIKVQRYYVWPVRGGDTSVMQTSMTPTSGAAGATFMLWGSGFTAGSTATLHFKKSDGTEYTTLSQSLDEAGHFSITYTAPADIAAGVYTWWAVDDTTGMKSSEVSFTIAAQSAYTLTVQKSGMGKGTIASSSSEISCGDTCSAQFTAGTQVTLSATASASYTFVGWTGACSGTGTCTVNMDSNATIGAMFQDPAKAVEHVVLLIVDGLRRDYFYSMIDSSGSTYPYMTALFKSSPYMRVDKGTSTFPTTTFSSNASLITGSYPATHGILGDAWCGRTAGVCRDYTGADVLRVYEEGLATTDLQADAMTMYDALADNGLTSNIMFHMYSGKNTSDKIIWTPPREADISGLARSAEKYDNNMMYDATTQVKKTGLPSLLTLYFGGHDYAVRAKGIDYSLTYMKGVIDPLIGVLTQGGTIERYGSSFAEKLQFAGLTSGFPEQLAKTVFVITSGHGVSATADGTIYAAGIRSVIEPAGFSEDNSFISMNGGMAHIYVRNTSTEAWTDYPQPTDLTLLYGALINQKSALGIDKILMRDSASAESWGASYKGYPKDLSSDDKKRLLKQSSIQSGDIILIPTEGYEYDADVYKANQGGLSTEDSLIPLVFSGVPFGSGQKTVKSGNIYDIAPTVAALLGVGMTADGTAIADVVNATTGSISVSTKTLSFGNVKLTKSSTKKLTVTNKGKKDVTLGQLSLSGTDSSEFTIPGAKDACSGQTIAPKKKCTASVVFTPATKGSKSATLTIEPSGIAAVAITVTGNGT